MRDDKYHQAEKRDEGKAQKDERVRHGTFDLLAHTGAFLNLRREALEDVVDDTSSLTGANHVDVNVGKCFWMLCQSVCELRAALYVFDDISNDRFKCWALCLRLQR